ncbi:MAG: hypothetical protein AMS14_03520, partial [Planctomycetes bacterium DG_20]
MTSDETQDRPPTDGPAEPQGPPPSKDAPAPQDDAPAEPVPGSEDTPLAQDLSAVLPVAEPVEPEPVPVAEPVRIPVAEEVAPPKPKAPFTPGPPRQRLAPRKPSPDEAGPPAGREPPAEEGERPPKRRGRRLLLVMAAAIVLLAAFAPTILSIGPVRQYVLDAANARLPIRVEAEGWGLSWFGQQQVRGLSVRMPDGGHVATVEHASLDEGLFSILSDRSRLGPIHVAGAEVWTAGLQQAVEAFSAEKRAEAPPPKPPVPPVPAPPFVVPDTVAVEDLVIRSGAGTVHVTQARLGRGKETDTLQADLRIRHAEASGTASLKARLSGISSDWRGPETVGVEGTVACTDLPVAALWAVAAEFGVPLDGGGIITAELAFSRARNGDVACRVTAFTGKDLS